MAIQIDELSNEDAVDALILVSKRWFNERGYDALAVVYSTLQQVPESAAGVPSWAGGEPEVTAESGAFSRAEVLYLFSTTASPLFHWVTFATLLSR